MKGSCRRGEVPRGCCDEELDERLTCACACARAPGTDPRHHPWRRFCPAALASRAWCASSRETSPSSTSTRSSTRRTSACSAAAASTARSTAPPDPSSSRRAARSRRSRPACAALPARRGSRPASACARVGSSTRSAQFGTAAPRASASSSRRRTGLRSPSPSSAASPRSRSPRSAPACTAFRWCPPRGSPCERRRGFVGEVCLVAFDAASRAALDAALAAPDVDADG